MKRCSTHAILIFIVALFFFSPGIYAGSPLDVRSRLTLEKDKFIDTRRLSSQQDAATADPTHYPLLFEFNSDQAIEELLSLGGKVYYTRSNMALGCIPKEHIDEFVRLPYISRLSLSRKASASVDRARAVTGVDAVHQGTDRIHGYDGTGVVTGFCDIGFDPAHPAFRGRVGMMSKYSEYWAQRRLYAPGMSIHTSGAALEIDTVTETHASHVANIMAGGYRGNPYYGVAPGADIAATTSMTSTMGLLCGIEDVIAYAKEVGKPAVVNLSMSSYLGPHDGTDITNRYLDLLGQEAIIVFSAGNNGNKDATLSHTFSETAPMAGSMFESLHTWTGHNVNGALDIWSADNRPFDIQLVVWDQTDKKIIYESPWFHPEDYPDMAGNYTVSVSDNDVWRQTFRHGFMSLSFGIDPGNNRFNAAIDFDYDPIADLPVEGREWARCVAGWRARSSQDVSIDAYTDGIDSYMRWYGMPGQMNGNADFSVNDMGCNRHTVCVGSWNSRNSFPALGGGMHKLDFDENISTWWSSYGTLRDGRVLPHFCAPGNYLVSAMNSAYHDLYPDERPMTASATVGGKTYYWYGECGTSMAAPMTAGCIALWLQADPELTVGDVIDVATRTARRDFTDIDSPHWGAGALDAAAGLRLIIDRAGIDNVTNPFVISVTDRVITVTRGSEPVPFTVHDISGRRQNASSQLAPGIYIVRAEGHTAKILID